MLHYKAIEIFTSEETRWQGKPLSDAIVHFIAGLKAAARCMVTRGTDGCYETGEIATRKLEVLSYNMPLRITIILPAGALDRVLPDIERMVTDGIVVLHSLDVIIHKTQNRLIPPQIKVRDVMTVNPRTVTPATPLDEVVRILLCSIFTGLPVVDSDHRPVGLISQGDLIYRAGMPLRLCLLAASEESRLKAFLDSMASKTAAEIMTRPAVSIHEDRQLTEAVDLMLQKGLKRLPVVDSGGRLVGIVSRMDLFRTIMKESPDWQTFKKLDIQVENLHSVSDIMRRDTHTVKPDTPLDEVMRIIDSNDIQRVAVVDKEGHYLGLISDEDLLAAFSRHSASLWDYVVSKMSFTEMGRKHKEFLDHLQAGTAGELMSVNHITVLEEAPMEEAIRLMTEHNLKRLPVLDSQGYYRGMVSRESLLRTGFTGCRI